MLRRRPTIAEKLRNYPSWNILMEKYSLNLLLFHKYCQKYVEILYVLYWRNFLHKRLTKVKVRIDFLLCPLDSWLLSPAACCPLVLHLLSKKPFNSFFSSPRYLESVLVGLSILSSACFCFRKSMLQSWPFVVSPWIMAWVQAEPNLPQGGLATWYCWLASNTQTE